MIDECRCHTDGTIVIYDSGSGSCPLCVAYQELARRDGLKPCATCGMVGGGGRVACPHERWIDDESTYCAPVRDGIGECPGNEDESCIVPCPACAAVEQYKSKEGK